MVKQISIKLLQCDETSPYTGRVYPLEEMEKAVAKYQEKIANETAYGTFGTNPKDMAPDVMDITKISHRVTELSINEDGEVLANVEFMDTPQGKLAMSLAIDNPELVRLSPSMIGWVRDNSEVYDAELFQTTWLPTED